MELLSYYVSAGGCGRHPLYGWILSGDFQGRMQSLRAGGIIDGCEKENSRERQLL